MAKDNEPAAFPGPGPRFLTRSADGAMFPSLEFENVPVEPGAKYHFLTYTLGIGSLRSFSSTVWTHAPDARTYLPTPEPPPSCVP